MKKSLMVAAVMMMTTIIFAQHKGKDQRRHDPGETMKNVLSLDETQYERVKAINNKYAAKYSELRKDSAQTRDEKHASGRTLRSERENEIKSVLTPEQHTKWEAYKAERLKEHKKKVSEKHDARIKSSLSLSDDQALKLKDANSEFREKSQALRKEDNLDKEEFKTLKAEHEAIVKSILTEEQFQKWIKHKEEMNGKWKHNRK